MSTQTQLDAMPLLQAGIATLGSRYLEALQQAQTQFSIDGPKLHILLNAQSAAPLGISVAQQRRQMPYGSAAVLCSHFDALAEHGLLRLSDSLYYLTEHGSAALAHGFGVVHHALAGYQPIPALDRLLALAERLVDAALAAPEPSSKPDLQASRRTDPGADGPAAARLDQYLTDLFYFRDDVHRASWQGLGVDGGAWEMLTVIWRGEASTLPELQQRLERHAYTPAEYDQGLAELTERGWLMRDGERYRLTPGGQAVRDGSEITTNRLFYAPWAALSADETAEFLALLELLRDAAPSSTNQVTG